MINYLSCPPSQEWVSKWQKKKLASSLELEAKGNPEVQLPFTLWMPLQTKTAADLATPKPLCINQSSGSENGINPNHNGLAPGELGCSVVRWQSFSSSLGDRARVK